MWNWLGITNEPKVSVDADIDESNEKDVGKNEQAIDNTENSKDISNESTKEGETESVEKKVTEVAANLGNYFYNFASAATKTATQTATKLKDTVDHKLEQTIVGDFNRENERFIQERETRRIGDAIPPWVGFHEEKVMKSQILALSADERNFMRDPPSGVDFQFNLENMMPIAMAVLKEDKDLEAMRFNLVPKKIKEEAFWKNYFYRVSLIKQSTQLSSLSLKDARKSPRTGSSESLGKSLEVRSGSTSPPKTTPATEVESPQDDGIDDLASSPANNEFASDAFDDTAHLSEEEKTQMLGLNERQGESEEHEDTTNANTDWELDKELQDELENFEIVNNNDNENEDDNEWQKEIEELLEEDK